jgi:hypothetical protein
VKTVYWLIGNKYAERAALGLRAARWSAGAFVATWAFHGINANRDVESGLFASLNRDARDSLACLALVPAILPLLAVAVSAVIVYGALYTAAREVFIGPEHPYRFDTQRGIEVNLLMRELSRRWRLWLRWGWWLLAATAGAVTVMVTGALLRSSWPSWLAWALIAATTWVILKIETLVTTARYRERVADRLPTREQIAQRQMEWETAWPYDNSGGPLLYAYSGLSVDEFMAEIFKLGGTGMLMRTGKLLNLVAIVLIYSLLPAPSVERFRAEGLLGCFFVNLHGVAGVAEENLGLAIAAGLVLLVLVPFSVGEAYREFMVKYRFPIPIIRQVLRREIAFHWWISIVIWVVKISVPTALLLWLSAVVADHWNSPLGGAVAFIVPMSALVWLYAGRVGRDQFLKGFRSRSTAE